MNSVSVSPMIGSYCEVVIERLLDGYIRVGMSWYGEKVDIQSSEIGIQNLRGSISP